MNSDKNIELLRYDERAIQLLLAGNIIKNQNGSLAISELTRAPYLLYEKTHLELITKNSNVLEIGSGIGLHTYSLLNCEAKVYALDISFNSLKYLKNRYKCNNMLTTQVGDMESLPFKDESFDVVCSAGSLSYGDNNTVMEEIFRVLKKKGILIIVDSLNHNPIYKLNRWVHYIRGERSLSTLQRMPTLSLIKAYGIKFENIDVRYFGSISWLTPFLSLLVGESNAYNFSNFIDRVFKINKSAFKFLMIAHKKI